MSIYGGHIENHTTLATSVLQTKVNFLEMNNRQADPVRPKKKVYMYKVKNNKSNCIAGRKLTFQVQFFQQLLFAFQLKWYVIAI